MKHTQPNPYTKKQLLSWVHQTTQMQLHNMQQLSNGAAFCLLLEMMSPSCIKLQKVNLHARLQHESLANLKLLSTGMLAANIDKKFQVARIAQKKTQDILELLQWFRKYFITHKLDGMVSSFVRDKPDKIDKADKSERQNSIRIRNDSSTQNREDRKPKHLCFNKPSLSSKKQSEDLVKDNQLRNIVRINTQIKKIVTEDGPAKAQDKLELIRKILLPNSNHEVSISPFNADTANPKQNSKQTSQLSPKPIIHPIIPINSPNPQSLTYPIHAIYPYQVPVETGSEAVKLEYMYPHTPSLAHIVMPTFDGKYSVCSSSQILLESQRKQQQDNCMESSRKYKISEPSSSKP